MCELVDSWNVAKRMVEKELAGYRAWSDYDYWVSDGDGVWETDRKYEYECIDFAYTIFGSEYTKARSKDTYLICYC